MTTRRKQRTLGVGRVFRRVSRHTGEELPTYWIAYSVHGHEVRESARTTVYDEAKDLLRKRGGELVGGSYVGTDRQRVTVKELLANLVADYENKGHASLPTARGHAKVWTEELGAERAVNVTTTRLRQSVRTWKQDGKTPATINRRLASLRHAFRLGKVPIDPTRLDFGEVMLPENSPLGKHISAAVFRAIYAELPTHLRDFFEFAYLTGVRKGQLSRTTVANVDTETWLLRWEPRDVKSRRPHEIALDGRPLEIIRRRWSQPRPDCPYLFHHDGEPIGDFDKAWWSACKRAGFPVGRKAGGYIFHNTRHTAVTNLVNAGVPAHEAMGVSGHRTRSVFDRYSIKLHEQTREALRRATAYVDGLSSHRRGSGARLTSNVMSPGPPKGPPPIRKAPHGRYLPVLEGGTCLVRVLFEDGQQRTFHNDLDNELCCYFFGVRRAWRAGATLGASEPGGTPRRRLT